MGQRGGQHAPANRQHLADLLNRLLEVAFDLGHGGNQQVADRVPTKVARVVLEAVLQQGGHRAFGVGERNQAVANVAGRENPKLLAQSARRAAVVRYSHDGDDVGGIAFDTAQHSGQSCTTTDDDNTLAVRHQCVA